MAWICVDLDDTLVQKAPLTEDMLGEEQPPQEDMPTDCAVEAMNQLAEEGHRLTVFTARFNAMPASMKQQMKEEIEQELQAMGFPEMEVWTGTFKPSADIFIDNNAVTYDNDWGLALAQTQQMLEDRGLAQGPVPGDAQRSMLMGQAEQVEDAPAEEGA